MSDLDKEEIEATRNIGKTADETENEIEKIIQFMIEDNYNISFISSIRSLMALYKTYLSLYNKEKETSHYIQSQLDIANAKLIEEKEKNKNKENILRNIQEEFNKYDWKNANPIQTYNQVKSLYQSIFLKEMEE